MLHVVKLRRDSASADLVRDRPHAFHRARQHAGRSGERFATRGHAVDTHGAVLDPIVAIRHRFVLEAGPDASRSTSCAASPKTAKPASRSIDKYQDKALADRVFDLAWTHSQVALRQLNVTEADAQLYGRIAEPHHLRERVAARGARALIASNRRNQTGLWGYAISGDLPIVLLKIRDRRNIELARQLVQAHAYWRMKGMIVDLVIWNDDRGGYRQIAARPDHGPDRCRHRSQPHRPAGRHFRAAGRTDLARGPRAAAGRRARGHSRRRRAVDRTGKRASQAKDVTIPRFTATRGPNSASTRRRLGLTQPRAPVERLRRFQADGSEYVIITSADRADAAAVGQRARQSRTSARSSPKADRPTPGRRTRTSSGSRPGTDDPVSDASGEAFYLRDEETGRVWSPTPLLPSPDATPYTTRHGFGYSVFEHIRTACTSRVVDVCRRSNADEVLRAEGCATRPAARAGCR